jgi:hypothetical protein
MWGDVKGIVADAAYWHVACAKLVYGGEPINMAIDGSIKVVDREMNVIGVLLEGQDQEAIDDSSCNECLRHLTDPSPHGR